MQILLSAHLSSMEDEKLYFELQKRFDGKLIGGVGVVTTSSSFSHEEALREAILLLENTKPRAILLVAPSYQRELSLEEIYYRPRDEQEEEEAPFSYSDGFSSLKRRSISAPLSSDGQLSFSYQLFYDLLQYVKGREEPILLGLCYIPSFIEKEGAFATLLEDLATTIVAAPLTKHLHLRPLLLDQLKAHLHSPQELAKDLNLSSLFPLSPLLKRVYGVKIQSIEKDPSSIFYYTYWLIIHREKRAAIGSIGPKGYLDRDGYIEIGYGLEEDWRGYGFMGEALLAFTKFALQSLSIKGVKATTHKSNSSSKRSLMKAGYKVINHDEELVYWLAKNQ